jgi:hypothetical protein
MTQTIQKVTSALSRQPVVRFNGKYIEEAPLYFANGTQDIDQKRGLSINGPSDAKTDVVYTIRIGIVSTGQGVQETGSFLEYLNHNTVPSSGKKPFATQSFPGFEKAFRCKLVLSSDYNEEILSKEVERLLAVHNPENRIKKAAEMYAAKVGVICRRVAVPEVIICHEPQNIEEECGAGMVSTKRRSVLTGADRKEAGRIRKMVETHKTLAPLSESTQNLLDMAVHQDFRRILKSKCLAYDIPTQILTQTVLRRLKTEERVEVPKENIDGRKKRRKTLDRSSLAWNLAAAIYYKANHFPWKVGYLKKGTCYVGISFYQDKTKRDKTMCASLAQVFSDTGEGMVVRGKNFSWDTDRLGEPHLTEENAFKILEDAISVYKEHHNNQCPNRIVIHKSSMYYDEERRGFLKACEEIPKYDFMSVSDGREVYFYRNGEKAVLRGTCIYLGNESFLVYTKGYIPYQRAYLGPRVPKPLEITQHYGDTSLEEIAKEMIALSRLDWNTADYCSYLPITLKCAYRVGEILGLVPQGDPLKQQYKFYM